MAPRPPESKQDFFARLRQAVAEAEDGEDLELRFGHHHFSHALCREGSRWLVRRLEHDADAAAAYLAEHGTFMPEHAEMLAKPGAVVHEAGSLDELIAALDRGRWPL